MGRGITQLVSVVASVRPVGLLGADVAVTVAVSRHLIRSHPCGHPDPFRSVRDLGRVTARCLGESGELEGRSSRGSQRGSLGECVLSVPMADGYECPL
jgi:hypothetical protein